MHKFAKTLKIKKHPVLYGILFTIFLYSEHTVKDAGNVPGVQGAPSVEGAPGVRGGAPLPYSVRQEVKRLKTRGKKTVLA
jgi:hypothetical protein